MDTNTNFALVDANNFYVSCERLFQPKLRNRPVIVLSNNDGCAIARSNEVKELGIEMGAPLFEIKHLVKRYGIEVLSANFALYGDISNRIYSILKESCPEVIQYSIDESFLDLKSLSSHYPIDRFCQNIVKKIYRYVGIPVTIGVGSTKTLSKVANKYAKAHQLSSHVYVLTDSHLNLILKNMPISDIWGIGKKWERKLNHIGIYSGLDLKNTDPLDIKKTFNVLLARTINELNHFSCIQVDALNVHKKSIMVSRSFGEKQKELAPILRALCAYTEKATQKLRSQNSVAGGIEVFLQTNMVSQVNKKYANSVSIKFPYDSSDTREIISFAKKGLSSIYREGFLYKKVGIILTNIKGKSGSQIDIFHPDTQGTSDQLMRVIDTINQKCGRESLKFLAQGFNQEWRMRQERLSNISVNHIGKLPIVHC